MTPFNGFTYEEFKKGTAQYAAVQGGAVHVPSPTQCENFNRFAPKWGGVTSKEEATELLAQILWESAGLTAVIEHDGEARWARGEYRDGEECGDRKYYGRGYIQLTYAKNYKRASQELYGDDRLWRDPDLVANDVTAMETACWYWGAIVKSWTNPNMDFGTTTRAINGALECSNQGRPGQYENKARKRWQLYQKISAALGLQTLAENGCY